MTKHGVVCRGVNWERHSLEDLTTIVGCVGGRALAAICKLLAEDYSGWSGERYSIGLSMSQLLSKHTGRCHTFASVQPHSCASLQVACQICYCGTHSRRKPNFQRSRARETGFQTSNALGLRLSLRQAWLSKSASFRSQDRFETGNELCTKSSLDVCTGSQAARPVSDTHEITRVTV